MGSVLDLSKQLQLDGYNHINQTNDINALRTTIQAFNQKHGFTTPAGSPSALTQEGIDYLNKAYNVNPASTPASTPTSAGTAPASATDTGPVTPNYTYTPPSYTPQRSASLMSAAELAALYGGITYDQDAIKGIFDNATKDEYNVLRKEYDATANKFYSQMYATQNTALDTIRRANASAVATGASRGIQAANELSAILGLEQTNTQSATDLATQRNLLMDKEAAAYTKNTVDALNTSNTVKQALGALGANIYASDTQFDVGQMQYYAALNQAAAALAGTQYTADSNLSGTKYASDQNYNSTVYNADQNLAAAKAAAEATANAAKTSAQATTDAAKISGQYSLQASQAANAAQAAYYNYMKSNGNTGNAQSDYITGINFVKGAYEQAMKDKDYTMAAMWFSQMTGVDYSEALKKVKAGAPAPTVTVPSTSNGATRPSTFIGPYPFSQIGPLPGTTTPFMP